MTAQLDQGAPPWCLRLISEFNSAGTAPGSGILSFQLFASRLEEGFEILSKHQQRHLLQAERIRAVLS